MTAPLAYLDCNIVSAIAKADCSPDELVALDWLLDRLETRDIRMVTSELTKVEISRMRGPNKPAVEDVYRRLDEIPFVADHSVLGFHSQWDRFGGSSQPLVEDDAVSTKLRECGLDRTDAHHLMLALRGQCDVFLTTDAKTILRHRRTVEADFPIRLLSPSEWMKELGAHTGSSTPAGSP